MITTKTKISFLSLVVGCLSLVGVSVAFAGNISPTDIEHFAWSGGGGASISSGTGLAGWIDFYNSDSVTVSSSALTGTANALQIGLIALDCSVITCTGAAGSWGVANDGDGNLSGWAWNDNIGWISFDSVSAGASFPYQVKIDGSTGDFSGWAWNDVVGWISFNCNNVGIGNQCPVAGSDDGRYKVKTSWTSGPDIPPPAGGPAGIGPGGGGGGGGGGSVFDSGTYLVSSIFDTKVQNGAALNTVMWLGEQPAGTGTAVGIQIASSNSASGPWTYLGPDSKTSSVYEANQGVQFRLNPQDHNNKRYFRYKVYLYWTAGATPEVKDVIINYSP